MPTDQTSARAAPLPGCAVLPPIERTSPRGAKREAGEVHVHSSGKKAEGRRRGRGGRFVVLNAFADYCMGDLASAEVKVWLLLFRDTKAATGTARTGQADLARRSGVSVRTVRRAVVVLERKGLLQVVRRGRLGTGASVYRVRAQPP